MNHASFAIVPRPNHVQPREGYFEFDVETRIVGAPDTVAVATFLASLLRRATGLPLLLEALGDDTKASSNCVLLTIDEGFSQMAEGSYQLNVGAERIEVQAGGAAGLFYGVQTLRQLLPAAVESAVPVTDMAWRVPAVTIEDSPRFAWRGLHLDVGRHLFPLSFIKKFLDLMALHKFNVFHWHLTEDQGWRIEIKQFPRLTEIGSQRSASPYPADRNQLDGQPYGGFYTQAEVREIVQYAQERFITVLPEIEMPGHAVAALASYPELGCVGQGYQVRTFWGIADDVFCAGNEATFEFLQKVLSEVLELFPGRYVHIGGDECPKVRWQACPKCQATIRAEGLRDEHELQSYFIRRIERFLNEKGRQLVGWDEILEGGLAPNATVMSWRGTEGGIRAAREGHDVIMSPTSHCYFDYYQSVDSQHEPPAIGGFLPLEKVYDFEPTEGIPLDQVHHVLGGQGNVWTEYMAEGSHVEYMTYPRASALAEAVWSEPTDRDFQEFRRRLEVLLQRLAMMGVNYRDPTR